MPKQRIHNEHFRTVSLGGRKTCPTCKAKLDGDSVWSWGEYLRARWRTVMHFCQKCFPTEVKPLLLAHAKECGCTFNLINHSSTKADWLTLK